MDWKDIQADIAAAAPVLGTLVGGPAGTAIGSLVATALGTQNDAAAVQQAIKADPNAAVKLRQIEADNSTKLQELLVTAENNRLVAETAAVASVNTTMQTEAKADHWPTYSWRPYCGFSFGTLALMAGLTVVVAYVGVMFFRVDPAVLSYLPAMLGALAAVLATIAPILGIASWFRGKAQADPGVATDNRG
jgi:hypothetical protein